MHRTRRLDGTTLAYLAIAVALAAVLAVAWCAGAAAEILKVNTASQKVVLGPFVTSTTGHTISTGLTVTATISKNGGALAARNSTVTPVSIGSGYYSVTLNATDTDTVGNLEVVGYASGYLRCRAKSVVLSGDAHDCLINDTGAGIPVDVARWRNTAVPAEHTAGYPIVTVKDGTGTGEIDTDAGHIAVVHLVDTLTTYTGNTVQTGDAFARLGAAGAGLTALGDARLANLDAAISTRAAAATALSDATWTDARAVKLDWLTGDAFARLGAAGAGLTALGDARLANLDAAISTRAAAATALSDATWTDARAVKLDWLTGDAFARLGAPAGASLSADVAAVPAGAVAALKASTGWTAGGAATFGAMTKMAYAMARGKFTIAGGTMTLYDDDNVTVLGTFTISSSGRTPN